MVEAVPVSRNPRKRKKINPPKEPMRGNIACVRCRKSKTKCINDRGTRECDSCVKNNVKCDYDTTPHPKSDQPGWASSQRPLKYEELGTDSVSSGKAYAEKILAHSFLNKDMLFSMLKIYQLHYSAELSFLHRPSLKAAIEDKADHPESWPPEYNLLLLGILALTARFNNDLTKHIAASTLMGGLQLKPGKEMPPDWCVAASRVFADALTKALGPLNVAMRVASVERVQAFLMLAVYEWSNGESGGFAAWMYLGMAIRMAQAMGLGFEDKPVPDSAKPEETPTTDSAPPNTNTLPKMKAPPKTEIRRRTMFSCLVLDRMLSHGQGRTFMVRSEDLEVELPCDELIFKRRLPHGYTGCLNPAKNEIGRAVTDKNIMSRFVQLVYIWGEISQYSFAGGRRTEGDNPPWQKGTVFRTLREKLGDFFTDLSEEEEFAMTSDNYHSTQASTVLVTLHILGNLCKIMLHREYIPFIPIRCSGPVGPLDPPTFDPDIVQTGFWETSAEEVFRAASDIIAIIGMCGERLPRSPIVLFAVWTAAFDGLYARHFPHMDTKRHMVSEEEIAAMADGNNKLEEGKTRKALETLMKLANPPGMASTYVERFRMYNEYFTKIVLEHHKSVGGGLDEWTKHNSIITQSCPIKKEPDPFQLDRSSTSRASSRERRSSVSQFSQVSQDSPVASRDQVQTPRSATSTVFTGVHLTRPASLTQSGPSWPMQEERHRNPKGKPQLSLPSELRPSEVAQIDNEETLASQQPFVALGETWETVEGLLIAREGQRMTVALNDITEFCGVLVPPMEVY